VSEAESFLERWARRKRAAANSAPDAASAPDATSAVGDHRQTGETAECPAHETARRDQAPAADGEPSPPAFDLTKLPSLDSITAETDIRAFMLPGVPAELSRAALRRAWSADPAIREFVGLADYDWDFNTEGAITGFGPIEMTEELRRRVTDMVGRAFAPDESEPSVRPTAGPEADENSGNLSDQAVHSALGSKLPGAELSRGISELGVDSSRNCEDLGSPNYEHTASQQSSEETADEPEVILRRHGRALPK
jgi:hypothetical protein